MQIISTRINSFSDKVRRAVVLSYEADNLSEFISNDVIKDYKSSDFRNVQGGWLVHCLVEDYGILATKLYGKSWLSLFEKNQFRKEASRLLKNLQGILSNNQNPAWVRFASMMPSNNEGGIP